MSAACHKCQHKVMTHANIPRYLRDCHDHDLSVPKSRKLAVASWSLSCFSKEGGSPGPECCYLIYQDYTPPPRGVQLHPTPPRYLLLLLLASHLRLALGCLLVAAACMLAAAGCWLPAACCLLRFAVVCCCCLGLLAAVGAEESLFVRIESSCIPSES